MAFPTVAARDTYTTAGTAAETHTIDLSGLGTISAGDGLLMVLAVDGGDAVTDWDGWTEVMQDEPESSIRIAVAYKDAVGSDADPVVAAGAGPQGEQVAGLIWRFTDVDFGTNPPQGPATAATAVSTSPQPASFTPTGGAIDRLWLSLAANDDDDATTGYPSDYTQGNRSQLAAGSGGCNIGGAELEQSVSSDQSNAFTIAAAEAWAAVHVTLEGTGGAGPAANTMVGLLGALE